MSNFAIFERIARAAGNFTEAADKLDDKHPFEVRNLHADLPAEVRRVFDNAPELGWVRLGHADILPAETNLHRSGVN